jgi:hypothetical protein
VVPLLRINGELQITTLLTPRFQRAFTIVACGMRWVWRRRLGSLGC